MNRRCAPLFDFLVSLDLVKALIQHEEKTNGDLADLAFMVEYDPEDHPGTGQLSVYRLSAGVGKTPVNVANDNMLNKLWFREDEVWQVERFAMTSDVMRFYAIMSYHPDYRPAWHVDFTKPLLNMKFTDLPTLSHYPQKRVMRQQQDLALVG